MSESVQSLVDQGCPGLPFFHLVLLIWTWSERNIFRSGVNRIRQGVRPSKTFVNLKPMLLVIFCELCIIGGHFWSNKVIRGQIMSYFFLDHSQGRIQLSNFIKFIEVRALSNILFITNQFISTCTQYESRGWFYHVMILLITWSDFELVESTGGLQFITS